jgi:hypothetical protein
MTTLLIYAILFASGCFDATISRQSDVPVSGYFPARPGHRIPVPSPGARK